MCHWMVEIPTFRKALEASISARIQLAVVRSRVRYAGGGNDAEWLSTDMKGRTDCAVRPRA